MDKFIVEQSKLSGRVEVSGSKNASLPIMTATLLTDEDCVIHKVPDLMDIRTMIQILSLLGKRVEFSNNTLVVKSTKSKKITAPYRLVRTMRASFCCLGPLLAKRKRAKVALPGGCIIGPRPVDLHIKGLASLGVDIAIEGGYCRASLKSIKPGRV
ncbi:MAG: UDP-N-acetylglucosamine 1-carboxyvinyltransferase, partial [Candidatus Omnitrophica bacterium]|nr:UDP-N-acetylglucosamine 1-carboxyvinyltransferase [Candidatus Omnitrophota bacterium]MBD3269221.1 UDP-N-acetylglucosamine 1-carboxyvinyltransferase [Candidatus Omnitrophota bacterium]